MLQFVSFYVQIKQRRPIHLWRGNRPTFHGFCVKLCVKIFIRSALCCDWVSETGLRQLIAAIGCCYSDGLTSIYAGTLRSLVELNESGFLLFTSGLPTYSSTTCEQPHMFLFTTLLTVIMQNIVKYDYARELAR